MNGFHLISSFSAFYLVLFCYESAIVFVLFHRKLWLQIQRLFFCFLEMKLMNKYLYILGNVICVLSGL